MIRKIRLSDATELHRLNRDCLGYDVPLSLTQNQLEKLIADPHHHFLVAEVDGRVIGYLHAQLYETLYFEPLWNLMALAVSADFQRQGIASDLMVACEALARQAKVAGIRVNSGISRGGAHAFYQKMGYEIRPDQKRFLKRFNDGDDRV